jgi:hypothetical protein
MRKNVAGFWGMDKLKKNNPAYFQNQNSRPRLPVALSPCIFSTADNGKKAAPHNFTPLATQKLCARFVP